MSRSLLRELAEVSLQGQVLPRYPREEHRRARKRHCLISLRRSGRVVSGCFGERDRIDIVLGIHRGALTAAHKAMRDVFNEGKGYRDKGETMKEAIVIGKEEGGVYKLKGHS